MAQTVSPTLRVLRQQELSLLPAPRSRLSCQYTFVGVSNGNDEIVTLNLFLVPGVTVLRFEDG